MTKIDGEKPGGQFSSTLFYNPISSDIQEPGRISQKAVKDNAKKLQVIIAYKKEEFEYRVLIHNRQDFMKVHTDAIVEKADVEDLMLFYIRGERVL